MGKLNLNREYLLNILDNKDQVYKKWRSCLHTMGQRKEIDILLGLIEKIPPEMRYKNNWVLEIGTFQGGTARILAALSALCGLNFMTCDRKETEEARSCMEGIAERAPNLNVVRAVVTSSQALEYWRQMYRGQFWLIFEDPDHNYKTLINHLWAFKPYVARKGYIVTHDTNSVEEKVAAVKDFLKWNKNWSLVDTGTNVHMVIRKD